MLGWSWIGNVIYSWISCGNATLGTSWKVLYIHFFVTVIWGQILRFQKSEVQRETPWRPPAAIFLFFSMGWRRVVSLSGWPRSQEPRWHCLQEMTQQLYRLHMLMFKRRKSKLRLEKVEDTAVASHLLHTLTAQGITSHNYLGAGVTSVATVQK